VRVTRQPGVERREAVLEDVNSRKRLTLERISALIGFVFSFLEGAIGLRVLLKLMEANPKNAFASFIYNFTALFLTPFAGLTLNPAVGGMVLELTSIVAMIVYALIAMVMVRLVWLAFYQPSARSVTTYERDRAPRVR
jgi:uncharacterized protein YggT (Ycf19 family)